MRRPEVASGLLRVWGGRHRPVALLLGSAVLHQAHPVRAVLEHPEALVLDTGHRVSLVRSPVDAAAVVQEALVVLHRREPRLIVERGCRAIGVQDRAAVLKQELAPVEAVVAVHLEAELVARTVAVRVLRELRGSRLHLVPCLRNVDAFRLELVGSVVERIDIEVEHGGHDVPVEGHRIERSRRVGLVDRFAVDLTP